MKMFESIKDQIKDFEKIVFVTGAGISQESGIPTFRGKDGLWRNHDAMKLATIDAFYDNPKLVWEWYNERRKANARLSTFTKDEALKTIRKNFKLAPKY